MLKLIKKFKPSLTVLISDWNSYSPYSNREFITDENNEEANSITTKRTIARRVPETIKEIEKVSQLIVFKSWPLLPKEPSYQIERAPFLQRNVSRTFVDVNEFNKDNEYINTVFNGIPSGVVFFNPSEKICSDKCVSILNGTKLYHDAYHITPQGSMQFRNEIEKLLD